MSGSLEPTVSSTPLKPMESQTSPSPPSTQALDRKIEAMGMSSDFALLKNVFGSGLKLREQQFTTPFVSTWLSNIENRFNMLGFALLSENIKVLTALQLFDASLMSKFSSFTQTQKWTASTSSWSDFKEVVLLFASKKSDLEKCEIQFQNLKLAPDGNLAVFFDSYESLRKIIRFRWNKLDFLSRLSSQFSSSDLLSVAKDEEDDSTWLISRLEKLKELKQQLERKAQSTTSPTNKKTYSSPNKKSKLSNIFCYNCNKPGHIKKNCREFLEMNNNNSSTCFWSIFLSMVFLSTMFS